MPPRNPDNAYKCLRIGECNLPPRFVGGGHRITRWAKSRASSCLIGLSIAGALSQADLELSPAADHLGPASSSPRQRGLGSRWPMCSLHVLLAQPREKPQSNQPHGDSSLSFDLRWPLTGFPNTLPTYAPCSPIPIASITSSVPHSATSIADQSLSSRRDVSRKALG
jgi:hypothetical protein